VSPLWYIQSLKPENLKGANVPNLLRRLTRSSATFLLCAVLCPLASSQEVGTRPALAPINPEFVRYRTDLEHGRIRFFTSDGHPTGLVPLPMDFSNLRDSGLVFATSYPARYDLRTLGKLSPIRDQAQCGSCWTFATMASAESSLLPGSSNDFSENNVKDTHGFDSSPCSGGGAMMSLAYLARWSGPVREVDDPYHGTDVNTSPATTSPAWHLQEAILLPARTGPLDNDAVKQAVTQYGPLYIGIYADAGFDSTNKYLYFTGNKSADHAVAVVGWDDNISRYNFATTPPGDGAFILRNSWGTAWGENGYFYMSYYDAVGGRTSLMAAYSGLEATSNYSRIYQYDPLGAVNTYGYSSDTGWFSNIFTAQSSESVAAVSFYTFGANSSYTVNVYTNVQGTPTNGVLGTTMTGTIATMGYHTIRLATPVPVASGSSFSVVVRLQTPNSTTPIPVEYAVTNYSSHAVAHTGESFVSSNGTSWQDTTTAVNATTNVCLKAFTTTTSTTSASVTVTTNPPGQAITADGTSYTSPHTFTNWDVGSAHSIGVTVPPASGGTRYAFANWSDSGAQTHTITTPSTATTYTANLNTQYLLTRNSAPAGSGSITASPSSTDGYYASGTSVQLTPAAASGYSFDSWSGDASGTTTTASVTMAIPRTVTANFRSSTATIVTANPPGLAVVVDGTSYTTPKTFSWTASSSHTIGATSPQTASGTRNTFANWSDGGAQTHTVSAPAAGGTFTASFSTQYALTVSVNPAGSGTVSATPASGDGYYNAGASVSLAATPAAGYAFAGWSGGLTGAATPQSVAMNGARTVTASFGSTAVSANNDSPSTATAVPSLPYSVSQDTGGSSSSSSDPVHSCTAKADSRTVWFRYTVTFNGTLRIDTFGSNYDTVLAVYNSTALAASELACNDDADEFNVSSATTMTVTNGQVLLIEVAGYGSSSTGGRLLLNITGQPAAAAANDETGSATTISSLPARFTEDTSAATAGAADPVHSCTSRADGHTVWFRYVALSSGFLEVNTLGSTYDTVLSIYDGAATAANEKECNDDISSSTRQSELLVVPVSGGHTYLIEVSAWKTAAGGGLVLNAMPQGKAPSNDLVGSTIVIPSLPYTIQQYTVDATQSPSDPRHSCDLEDGVNWPDLRTVWFRYTAAFTGTIQIDTYGSDYDTVLSAYPATDTGTELACNDDANDGTVQSAAVIGVTAGKSYLIEVSDYDDGEGGSGGLMQLNVNGTGVASIGNDEPATATAVSSLPFTITQTTQPATMNSADPVHSCTGKADSATVWFRYVATADGTLSVDAAGSDYYTVLAIYSGSAGAGAELGCNGDWTSSPRSGTRATVSQGQSYLIEASGWNKAGGGTLTLNASLGAGSAPTSTIDAVTDVVGQPGLTPGGFATIWGVGLSATTGGWWDFPGGALPTSLDGVSVLVDGKKAYVNFISPEQINFIVPGDSTVGDVPVQVTNAKGSSNVYTSRLQTVAPAFFTYEAAPQYAIGSLPNGRFVGPIGLLGSGAVTQPAKPGDVVALWMTGLGPTTPAYPEGQLVTSSAPLANAATVTVGGVQAAVDWAGVVGAGLYQVNFHVPTVAAGDQTIQVAVNGASAQSGIFINIGH
jgi:uncharacterized protein (TIGR03437 family)